MTKSKPELCSCPEKLTTKTITEIDFFELLELMDKEATRIGLSKQDFQALVLTRYQKKSRYLLTDSQLFDLLDYLRLKPSKSKFFTLPKIELKRWKKQ